MSRHSVISLIILAASLAAIDVSAADDPPRQGGPTAEQLTAAKKAFEALGGGYEYREVFMLPSLKFHYFGLELEATDADLKKIPQVPFPFGLSLVSNKITDIGLTALRNQTYLVALNLDNARVTDAGLAQLKPLVAVYSVKLALRDLGEWIMHRAWTLRNSRKMFAKDGSTPTDWSI